MQYHLATRGPRLVPGALPPATVPPGYAGPLHLPGTGRMVWWTGRVAIGLLHARPPAPIGAADAERLQLALLDPATLPRREG